MNTKVVTMNPLVQKLAAIPLGAALTDNTGASSWVTASSPPYLQLFNNLIALTSDLVNADLIECTFSGYTGVQTTTPVLQYDPDGNPFIGQVLPITFTMTSPTPDVCYGIKLVAADDSLIAAELLDVPFAFDGTGDKIVVYVRMPVLFGQAVLVN